MVIGERISFLNSEQYGKQKKKNRRNGRIDQFG